MKNINLTRFGEPMRQLVSIITLLAMLGCACHNKYDTRLNGTWQSNREQSVADAFSRDLRWAKAPPEKIERFKEIFGHLTVTYSSEVVSISYRGEEETCSYTVQERGEDFVVIRLHGGPQDGQDIHIQFVDGGQGYWITSQTVFGTEVHEKFDKIMTTQPGR
jgi:hypothetical protein